MADKTETIDRKGIDEIAARDGFPNFVKKLDGAEGILQDMFLYSTRLEDSELMLATYDAETGEMVGKPYKPMHQTRTKFHNPESHGQTYFKSGAMNFKRKNLAE